MGSFRNQLLVVIIGLVCVTQTVTLIAVLARTEHSVQERAAKQLVAGSSFVEQLVRFRAAQLASGVAVLAADFGFREAVASGDRPTMLSAAQNDVRRIGADLMVLLDDHGHVLASTAQVTESSLQRVMSAADLASDRPHVMVLAGRAYQFFLAPVRAPETIGWVAMGFAIDDTLALHMSELSGAPISLVTRDQTGVEKIEVWNLLRRLGCDLAQGYLISKPLPANEVLAFVGQANRLLQDSDSTQLQMRALEQLAAIRS